jgi:hypothetical protein
VEGKHQHHNHGLADGVGILSIARGLLHLQPNYSFEMIRRSQECVINVVYYFHRPISRALPVASYLIPFEGPHDRRVPFWR